MGIYEVSVLHDLTLPVRGLYLCALVEFGTSIAVIDCSKFSSSRRPPLSLN